MLNQGITAFLGKAEAKMEEYPDVDRWCWRVSAGDRRSKKKVVHGNTLWSSDSAGMIDEMFEALEALEGQPVDHAWLEMLQQGHSTIYCYEHVEVCEPTEQPQVIMPDGKRIGIGENYSSAVMATQLVRTNDQLLNLSTSLARMNANLTQKQMDVAIAYTELETEGRVRGEIDATNNMAEALKVLGPMLQAAFLKWSVASGGQAPPEGEPAGVDVDSPPVTPPEESEGLGDTYPNRRGMVEELPVSEAEVDDLLDRIEWVCKFQPELLTESRVARVVTAFTSGP